MRAQGHSILEFMGRPGFTPRRLAKDLFYSALAIGFSYALFVGVPHWLPLDEAGSNPLLPNIPSGVAGIVVWIGLSLSAGICEEIVFRGYLQRQLAALSGNIRAGVLAHTTWDILEGLGLI